MAVSRGDYTNQDTIQASGTRRKTAGRCRKERSDQIAWRREIGEGETAGEAENHRLGEIEASVIEKRGDHTALTMGVLLVFEGLGFRHSLFPGKVFKNN